MSPGAKKGAAGGVTPPGLAPGGNPTPEEIGSADTAMSIPGMERAATESADPAADSLVGTTLSDRYQISRKIGQGGMGAVYEATHTLIGKRVAIKVLLDKYAGRDPVVARLEQEARLASSIGHEHIIDITDFGKTADGRTFVVMEFLDGESLAECLHREGPLPEHRILQIAVQIASALSAAHAKGVIHRDIKPENVFLVRRKGQEFVKVVDFGISKSLRATDPGAEENSPRLTQTGMVLGTPLYMSPEQARGDDELDQRIDIYALGVILYELTTGSVPYTGANYLSVISQVLSKEPASPREKRPDLSEELEAIILRALEKDRVKRYQSADEMLADLTAVLEDPSRSTQRPRILPPLRFRSRSGLRTVGWVAAITVVVAAVVFSVVTFMGGAPPAQAAAADGATAVAMDAAAAMDAAVAPPQPAVVQIPIDSTPRGAKIYEGGRFIGVTPARYGAPVGNDKVELRAELDGYEPSAFTVNPLVDKERTAENPVMVELKKKAAGRRPKASGAKAGSGTDPAGGGDLSGNPYQR